VNEKGKCQLEGRALRKGERRLEKNKSRLCLRSTEGTLGKEKRYGVWARDVMANKKDVLEGDKEVMQEKHLQGGGGVVLEGRN